MYYTCSKEHKTKMLNNTTCLNATILPQNTTLKSSYCTFQKIKMSKFADCSSLAQKRPQAAHVADFGKCKISQEGGE